MELQLVGFIIIAAGIGVLGAVVIGLSDRVRALERTIRAASAVDPDGWLEFWSRVDARKDGWLK